MTDGITTTYDDFGRATTKRSASGLTLNYGYSALDQVTSIAYPAVGGNAAGSTFSYVYDSANSQLLDSVTDRAGNTTSYQYDARFLKTQETASNGGITQYAYDPLGRLAMQTDALGHATLWGYDQFDQVTQMAYPDSTLQNPRVATYTYDAFGKLLTQGGTGQYPVTYGYDAAGNRISLTDGNNSQTQWGYDGLNRVTSKTYADSSTYHYSYDPAGNLASRVDALGRTTQYHYNAYNLVAQVVYPTNPAVSFQYDALGRRTQMTDGTGTTTWSWDNASRNTGYTQGAVGQGIAYGYDAENHRVQMVAAGVAVAGSATGWTTQYGYDQAGRLQTILDNRFSATSPFTYAYQSGTNWIVGHSNADGSATLNQYDVLGRLTRVTAANATGSAINTYAYNYDAASQRTQEASTVGTRNFGYDNLRQLTSAYRVDGSGNPLPNYNFSYAFDSIGNWTKSTSAAGDTDFTANHLNQYTGISGAGFAQPATPQYDLDGNMTSDGQGNTYVYDEENRLIEVDTPGNAAVAKTVSVYDGLSRRIEKRTYNSGGTLLSTTRYLYDGLLPIAEYDSGNNLTTTYTRGLDLSGTMQGAGGIGGLLALTNSAGNSYSYFTDGNGNIVDLTDAYGTSAAHYEYDPFGNLVAQTGSLQQNYQWSSKETEAGTGLVYYLYRFYNPSFGRWIQRDPEDEEGGINLYSLVNNDVDNDQDVNGDYPRGSGHHVIPWDIFNEKVSAEVQEFFNADNQRIWSEYYNTHDGSRFGGITPKEYNQIVSEELKEFLGKEPLKDMTVQQAQAFYNRIISMPEGSAVTRYNSAIRSEAERSAELAALFMKGRMQDAADKAAAKAFVRAEMLGARRAKKLARAVPIVGELAVIYFTVQDANDYGWGPAVTNALFDSIPLVGEGKNIGEAAVGYRFLDTPLGPHEARPTVVGCDLFID